WVFYLIRRELAAYVVFRQDFLMSREHVEQPQARTVLVTGVAKEYLNEKAMEKLCSVLPGGVSQVWLARNMGDLPDLSDRLNKACGKLESAETKILKLAAKKKANEAKSTLKAEKKGDNPPRPADIEADQAQISRYVSTAERPKHKLGFLGFFGEKVDTINWAREEIGTTRKLIEESRAVYDGLDAQKKASGLIAAIPSITRDPASAVTLLAIKLPAASTFFLTYFVTTALGGASGSLLQREADANEIETLIDHEHTNADEKATTFPPPGRTSGENLIKRRKDSAASSSGRPGVSAPRHHDTNAFDHPASYERQRVVWIPSDVHGFSQDQIAATVAAGVEVSSAGSTMDAKGHVDVTRGPPGEKWHDTPEDK
ncbi:calcium permeable stress-gated cation channel, partial [Phenoliferia sp. Uapishka_3]